MHVSSRTLYDSQAKISSFPRDVFWLTKTHLHTSIANLSHYLDTQPPRGQKGSITHYFILCVRKTLIRVAGILGACLIFSKYKKHILVVPMCHYLRAERIWWAALRLLRARQAEASLRQEKKRLFRHF